MAAKRYSRIAITLHWLIALAVIAMVPLGWWMSEAIADPDQQQIAYRAFQLHKSVGLTILLLTLVRLGVRLANPVPPLPANMKTWERLAARGVHGAFYALLLALPLSGWLYVSAGWSAPTDQALGVATSWFGLLPVPHLPGLADAALATRRMLAFQAMGAHSLMAWGGVLLFLMHAGAALKHHFINRDGVLGMMVPMLARSEQAMDSGAVTPAKALAPWAYPAGAALILTLGLIGWVSAAPNTAAPDAAALTRAETSSSPVTIDITPGTVQQWMIDYPASAITFAGVHAGSPFEGQFGQWEGHIWFDPADLAGSRATVLVHTASAKTGDSTQEGSLAEAEWFDPANFPVARFDADSFTKLPSGEYQASGILQIKDGKAPVSLTFSFAPTGDSARVEGTLSLDRTALNLGMSSDAAAQWVSRLVDVTISVTAKHD